MFFDIQFSISLKNIPTWDMYNIYSFPLQHLKHAPTSRRPSRAEEMYTFETLKHSESEKPIYRSKSDYLPDLIYLKQMSQYCSPHWVNASFSSGQFSAITTLKPVWILLKANSRPSWNGFKMPSQAIMHFCWCKKSCFTRIPYQNPESAVWEVQIRLDTVHRTQGTSHSTSPLYRNSKSVLPAR